MKQEILDEIQTLFAVVRRRLDAEVPESVSLELPLYSNTLSREEIEAIRSGLEAELAKTASGHRPKVTPGRVQDDNEGASLIVSFENRPVV